MKIRTKLFIFVPLLVLLLNIVSIAVFQSSKVVQESYNILTERILLYKQISNITQENLRALNNYIINQDDTSYEVARDYKSELILLKQKLSNQEKLDMSNIPIKNYENMIATFLTVESTILDNFNEQHFQDYLTQYTEAEKVSDYIREEGQSLVDLELVYYQPFYKEMIHNSQVLNRLGVGLFFITIILSMVFVIWISRSISTPINRLVEKANQISKGDLNIDTSDVQTKDEIGILGKTFAKMLEDLKSSISRNMEMLEHDRLVKELELKALQSQINPHFLFNTLNVISKLAYIEGAEKTSDLTVSMSNLIRYNLRKLDQPVTLKDELDHVKEYFSIQKARFRDRVEVKFDIDEAVLNQMIPCLTLQPILENAFVHGIDSLEKDGFIMLSIQEYNHHIRIEIADNGVGMSEITRKRLLLYKDEIPSENFSNSPKSSGIGTRNVFKRIQLFYGDEASINIESDYESGTKVIFCLPTFLNRKELEGRVGR